MKQMKLKDFDDLRERFILVDFKNTLWKSWKVSTDDLKRRDGYPTGHVFRFLRTLIKWKGIFGGTPVFFYEGDEKIRFELFPAYKAGRKTDEEFDPIPDAMKLISYLKCIEIKPVDAEADDAIAAFIKKKPDASHLILSSDKDLWALRSPTVQIMSFQDILNDYAIRKKCKKHFGVESPKSITMAKALYGDSSDNLPKVPRLFKKHVAPVLEIAGDPDEFFSSLDDVPEKTVKKIMDHEDQIRKVYDAVKLRDDTRMKKRDRDGDPEGLEQFLNDFECYSLISRVKFMTR